jgi:CysZ protein
MSFVIDSLRRAAGDLFRPRVLTVLFLPMLAALLLWGGLAWWFGASWVAGLQDMATQLPYPDWLSHTATAWLTGFAIYVLLALLLVPAIYTTALIITAVIFMPMLVGVVGDTHYPRLQRLQGGSFMGSLLNSVYALLLYLLVWLLTLPFWLLAPFGAAIALLLNAWLNQRLFMYDALAEHASTLELQLLRRQNGWPLYAMAALLGLLHFVPVVNLLAPVYMGLAFTHYALGKLNQYRSEGTP